MSSKYDATFAIINLLLGTGPLIIPAPFLQSGFLLATIWLVLLGLISYLMAEYIIESISRSNCIKRSITATNQSGSLLGSESGEQLNSFELVEPIEYGQMGKIFFNRAGEIFCTGVITFYLMGVMVSKCIMTGKILSNVFHDVKVLNSIYFWLGIFFLSGSVFSFRNVQQTKGLQIFIILIRMLALGFMLVGALYLIFKNGSQGLVPPGSKVFNIEYYPELFSNTIFALLCHHSLPTLLAPVKDPKNIKFALRLGFGISVAASVLISLSAILAFGSHLGDKVPGGLNYYNYDFKNPLPVVYYFVSFYVFLNVAAIPIYTIVLRNNILKIVAPQVDSKTLSKPTVLATLSILSIVLLIVFFAQDFIQYVLDFTGGLGGVFILCLIPCYLVIVSRQRTIEYDGCMHTATFSNNILPYALIVFGCIALGYNLTEIIIKLAHGKA